VSELFLIRLPINGSTIILFCPLGFLYCNIRHAKHDALLILKLCSLYATADNEIVINVTKQLTMYRNLSNVKVILCFQVSQMFKVFPEIW